ncbi:MAG: hypothetical protein C4538_12135 [Nitrospiraceae bacterium]|nr:MAG: hypothetical protein C4538_12135 [Nitrospiraceae bacterium]
MKMFAKNCTIIIILIASTALLLTGFPFVTAAETDTPLVESPLQSTGGKIAILVFDNFSVDKRAGEKLIPALKAELQTRGFEVMDEDAVSEFLCKERSRLAGYVSGETARKLYEEFQVQSILTGSIISFFSGDDPHVGLVARLIDTTTGLIVWADYAFVSGADVTSILGLGRTREVEKLVPGALDRLLESFHVSPAKREKETTYRVAVIPFQNKSRFDGAGMVAMYMFLVELLKQAPFEPIEFGDVRKMLVELQVRSNGELDYKRMEELSKELDADTVLLGTVESYPSGSDTSTASVISMTARLLDARNNKILWYNTSRLNSEKNVIAFEWGEKEPADRVAYNVVSSMVKQMKKALSQ